MSAPAKIIFPLLRMLPKAILVAAVLAAPMMLVSKLEAGQQTIIEAPVAKKMGAGLVLLVSLQRA